MEVVDTVLIEAEAKVEVDWERAIGEGATTQGANIEKVPQAEVGADQEGVAGEGAAMQGADFERVPEVIDVEVKAVEVTLEDGAN